MTPPAVFAMPPPQQHIDGEDGPCTPLINRIPSNGALHVHHAGRRIDLDFHSGSPATDETIPMQQGDARRHHHPTEGALFQLPEAIKLGLGDFIFYSVLVGRAAMYDMLTVFACYLAIIAGLGCTLLWLAVARKALPALPVSIALAVIFYFVSRFVMEPVILPMTLHLVYF